MSKLYFRYGAMNAGKSAALLSVAHNYEEKGMSIILLKPSIDTKGDNKVTSRIGIERDVDILLAPEDFILDKDDIKELIKALQEINNKQEVKK